MSFKQLVSYFGRVNKQVEAGLYNVKRVYSFLRRIAESDEQYAKEIKKHTQHEEQRRKGQQEDAMMQYLMVVVDVQEVVMQTLKKQEKFAADVRLQVVKPLEDFHDKSEDARKKLAAEERRVSTQISSMKAAVAKERQTCFKLWEEMLKVKKDRDEEEARETTKRSNFDKLCAKLLELRKKASQQFAKFEKLREQTLAQLAEFRSSTLPSLLDKMHQIEKDRLMILKIHLNAYMALYKEYRAPIPRVASFETMLGNLNPEPQLQNFVDNIQRVHADITDAKEEEVFSLQCDLPCAASYVLTDQWFSAGGTGGPAQPILAGTALPATPSIPSFATQPQSSPRSSPPPPAGPAPSAPAAKVPPPASPPPPTASGPAAADAPVFLRALYDFMDGDVAAGDLLFKTGDIIRVVHRDSAVIDPNLPAWWDGVVFSLADGNESKVGHFPSNYTEAVPPNEYEALVKHYQARRAAPNERKQPAPPPFNPPTQRLTVVSRPSNAVPLGALPGLPGLPRISESAPDQPPPQPPAPAPTPGGDDPSVLATATAFYDYEYVPCGDPSIDGLGYIRFSAGDSILVVNMEDPEWWVGIHPLSGATGFFPANLVSVQRDPHVARLSVSY